MMPSIFETFFIHIIYFYKNHRTDESFFSLLLDLHILKSGLGISYVSQQQLKSFNFPYQLGFRGDFGCTRNDSKLFEAPQDAETAVIQVMPGDVIIFATDGLFDNLDLVKTLDEVVCWQEKWFPGGREYFSEPLPGGEGDSACAELAQLLVYRARQLSLDSTIDSPFALLAKENDIMWGGGMPDDTTVIVMRVVQDGWKGQST
jgi:protein phosphatase PTC7